MSLLIEVELDRFDIDFTGMLTKPIQCLIDFLKHKSIKSINFTKSNQNWIESVGLNELDWILCTPTKWIRPQNSLKKLRILAFFLFPGNFFWMTVKIRWLMNYIILRPQLLLFFEISYDKINRDLIMTKYPYGSKVAVLRDKWNFSAISILPNKKNYLKPNVLERLKYIYSETS